MFLSDWSNFQSYYTTKYYKVNDYDDFEKILEYLFKNNIKFKIIGSLHSCSNITESYYYIDISNLKNIEINDNEIICDGGTKLEDLLNYLINENLSITATGGVTHQSISGIISTNTMPASAKKNIDESINKIDYYVYEENKIKTKTINYSDIFIPLGYNMIIKKVYLKKIPNKKFNVVEKIIKYDDFVNEYNDFNKKYDFWRINYIYDLEKCLLWCATESDTGIIKKYDDTDTNLLNFISKIIYELENRPPNKEETKIIYEKLVSTYGNGKNYYGDLKDMIPRDNGVKLKVSMAEWFFKSSDFQNVLVILKNHLFKDEFFIPSEIEPIKSTFVKLSPSYSKTNEIFYKCNFMFSEYQNKDDTLNVLRLLWDDLINSGILFRFHYGKIHFGNIDILNKIYDHDDIEDFKKNSIDLLKNNYYYDLFEDKNFKINGGNNI